MITIRPWQIQDCGALPPMLLDLLAENAPLGAEISASDHNAGVLLALGMQWASHGEPTLVACDSTGQVIGFTLWGDLGNPAGLDRVDKTCSGLGTYVVPAWRRMGVATELRRAAGILVREKGYDRVLGVAYGPAGLGSMRSIGATVIGQVTEWRP